MSAGVADVRPGPGAPRTRHRTQEAHSGWAKPSVKHRYRPLPRAILRRHGLAVKKRVEGRVEGVQLRARGAPRGPRALAPGDDTPE
jgi:hypothetical protein